MNSIVEPVLGIQGAVKKKYREQEPEPINKYPKKRLPGAMHFLQGVVAESRLPITE